MTKQELRKQIREWKKKFTAEQLQDMSGVLFSRLERHSRFKEAGTVLLYYSLPDEVATHAFVEKWSRTKDIILPLVAGDRLELRRYTGRQDLCKGSYGIWEPSGERLDDYSRIDFAVIPGMGFDRNGNRLGRGKGYYDRLLSSLVSYKVGVCFGFQVVDEVPTEAFDIAMDEVWTEDGCISGS